MIILELDQLHYFLYISIYLAANFLTYFYTVTLSQFILIPSKFAKLVYNTFAIPCRKSKIFSVTFLIMKNIVVFAARFRFPVKLVRCVTFEPAFSASCLLRSIAISQSVCTFLWSMGDQARNQLCSCLLGFDNFWNVFIYFLVIFYFLVKKIDHDIVVCHFCLSKKFISCVLF